MPVHFASDSPPSNGGEGGDAQGSAWGHLRLMLGQSSFSDQHHNQLQQEAPQQHRMPEPAAAEQERAVGFSRPSSAGAANRNEILRLIPEQEQEVAQTRGAKEWKTFVAGWLADEEEARAAVDGPNGRVTTGMNNAMADLAGDTPGPTDAQILAPMASFLAAPKSAMRKVMQGVSAAPKARAKSAMRRQGATSAHSHVEDVRKEEVDMEEEDDGDDMMPAKGIVVKRKKKKKERDRKNPFVMPALHTFAFENLVHNIVWRVGRNFGFQAFNVNPRTRNRGHSAEWTPATIFVAGDHLTQMLVKNYFIRRDKGEDERQEERFAKAVFELHTTIFYSYEEFWTHMHGLSIRPMAMQEVLNRRRFCDEAVVCGLLSELALYFLIYTESSSMRHTPELLWFLYWCMNHSYVMQDMWGRDPPENFPDIREVRIGLRNKHQTLIRELQNTLGIYPDRIRPEDCGRLGPIMSRLKGSDVPEDQRIIIADLIAFGDGNFYYERIVTPIFYVISYEIDHLSNLGVEVAHRLGYDDLNESMAHTGVVRLALRDMRVRGEQIVRGEVNEAYNTITRLGYTRGRAETNFDPQVAADWWRSNVFVKTYRERRTWLAVFRAYYRVYTWHLVLYHGMQAQAFVGWNYRMISSCIITHAFCTALERFSNWYMTRNPPEPLQTALSKVFDKKGNFKISHRANAQALAAARAIGFGESKAIGSENVRMEPVRVVEIEGSPYLGTLGLVEWVILAFFILGWYVLQFYEGPYQEFCRHYWNLFSGCYAGAFVLHFLLTTRDGYTISLTHALNLGPILKASSSRPDPANWIMGTMHMKWKLFFLDALFWIIAFAMKIPFDYFIICKPSVEPLKLTFQVDWLDCPAEDPYYWGIFPCIGADWVLAFVRLAPFIIVVLLDTSLFYQVSTTLFGLFRGLFKLDLGVLTAWEEVVKEFYKAPYRWWFKCMSEVGNRNQLTLLKTMLFDNAADPDTGAIVSDGRMFKKAVLTPEEIMGTKKRSVNVAVVLDGDDGDNDSTAPSAGQGPRGAGNKAAGKDATGGKNAGTGSKGAEGKPLSNGWKTALQNFGLHNEQQKQKSQPKIGPKGGPLLPTSTNMKAMQKQLNQMQRLPVKLPMTTITERMLASTERQRDDADAAAGTKPKLASVAEKLLGNKQRGSAAAAAAKLKELSPDEKRKDIISRIQAAQKVRKEGGGMFGGGFGDAPSAAGLPAGDLMRVGPGSGGDGGAAGLLINAPPSPKRTGPQVRWGRAMAAATAARRSDENGGGGGGEPRRDLLTMDAEAPDEPIKAPDEEEALRPFSAGTVGPDSRKVLLPSAGRARQGASSNEDGEGVIGGVKSGASLPMPLEEVDDELEGAERDKPVSAGSAATPETLERAAVLNPATNSSTQIRASTPTLFGSTGRLASIGGATPPGNAGAGLSLDADGVVSSRKRDQLDPQVMAVGTTPPASAPDRIDSFGFGASVHGHRDLQQGWPSLLGNSGGSQGSSRISASGVPQQPPRSSGFSTVGSMETPALYSLTGAPSDAEAMARTLSSNRQGVDAARGGASPGGAGGGSMPRPSRLRNKVTMDSTDMGDYQPVASPRLDMATGAPKVEDVDGGDLAGAYQGYNRMFDEQNGPANGGAPTAVPLSPERGATPSMLRPLRTSTRSPPGALGDAGGVVSGGGSGNSAADLLRITSLGPGGTHLDEAQARGSTPTSKPGSGGGIPVPLSPPGRGGGRVAGPSNNTARSSSSGGGNGSRPGPVAEGLVDRIDSGLEAVAGNWETLAQSGIGPLMAGASSMLAWDEEEDTQVASWWTQRLEAAKARSYRMQTRVIDEEREEAALSSLTGFRADGDPLAMVYEWRVTNGGAVIADSAARGAEAVGRDTEEDKFKGAAAVGEAREEGADLQVNGDEQLKPHVGARRAAELSSVCSAVSCSSSAGATAGYGSSGGIGSTDTQGADAGVPSGSAAVLDAALSGKPVAEAMENDGGDRLGSPDLLGTPTRYRPPPPEADVDPGLALGLTKKATQSLGYSEGATGGMVVRSVSGTSLHSNFFKDMKDDDAVESFVAVPVYSKTRLKLEPIKTGGDSVAAAGSVEGGADGGGGSGRSSRVAAGKSGRRRSVAFSGQEVEEYTVPSGGNQTDSPGVALVDSGSNRMAPSTGQARPTTAGDGDGDGGIMSRWLAGLSGWTGLGGNKVAPTDPEDDEAADEEAAVRAARQLQGGGDAGAGGQGSKATAGQESNQQERHRSFRASFLGTAPSFRAGVASFRAGVSSFRAGGGIAQPTTAGQGRPTTSLPRSTQARSKAMGPPGLRPGSAMRPLTALRPTTAMRPTTARPVTALLGHDPAKEAKRKEKKDREQAIERAAGTITRSDSLIIIDGADPDEDEEIDEVHAQMMMWNAFAFAWDEIIDDLRQADYINDKEVSMLKFVRLDMGSRGHGLRPILLPTFFYAGQVRKVVDTGQVSTAQIMVLNELRVLVVWLGCQVGLLSGKHAHVITSAPFVRGNINVKHALLRKKMLTHGLKLVDQLELICERREVPFDMKDIADNLYQLWVSLEGECFAVHKASERKRATPEDVELASILFEVVSDMKQVISSDPEGLKAVMKAALLNNATADYKELLRVIRVIKRMLVTTEAEATPQSEEAQRILGFFINSLGHPSLDKPPSIDKMWSWSILTPLYEEDVLYALDAKALAKELGLRNKKMTDLLSETDDSISLMSYLKAMFPYEWSNFKERMKSLNPDVNIIDMSEHDFAPGCEMHEFKLELQMWASLRGQLLARTVHGMMLNEVSLRVLAKLEHPMPPNMTEVEYKRYIDQMVNCKFEYVVTPQTYGKNRVSKDLRLRWLASSIDILMQKYPRLKVAFLDHAETDNGPTQFSVMARGRDLNDTAQLASLTAMGIQEDENGVIEFYRVRLPLNKYSGRGVIIGEGKPENQNHAVIFAFGEGLQAIDMNQDNVLAETLKSRNLVQELLPSTKGAFRLFADDDDVVQITRKTIAAELLYVMRMRQAACTFTALVGFREWIFSDKAGALGRFAAATEYAFGTITQRTLTHPARIRLHYGHPDLFNKMFTMTRGGISKATRQLHLTEDVFCGCNHTLRGGRIRYKEYISCGKGRDMGFDSINGFNFKIAGGGGEWAISRESCRLGSRLDFFRLLMFYHSCIGFYINSWLTTQAAFWNIYALLVFNMAKADSESSDMLQRLYNVQQVLQLGTLAMIPYIGQLILEMGVVKAIVIVFQQILTGSLFFYMFQQQTVASSFIADIAYGSAKYVGTGRGFNITALDFVKIYTLYGRSHMYYAFELMSMLITMYIVRGCQGCNYGSLTWSGWLLAFVLVFAPLWFNPFSFDTAKVKVNFQNWERWMRGDVDPNTGSNWYTWNNGMLEKMRNDNGNNTDNWVNIAFTFVGCLPYILLTVCAASRLDIRIPAAVAQSLVFGNQIMVFIMATVAIWFFVYVTIQIKVYFTELADHKPYRIYRYIMTICMIIFLIVWLAVIRRWYDGNGFATLCVILYANFQLLIAFHKFVTVALSQMNSMRAFVDSFYYTVDQVIGYTLFVLIAFLSFLGVVGVMQMKILFNDAFAQTAGHARIARAMKDNKVGFDMRGKPGGGAGGKPGGAAGPSGMVSGGGMQPRSLVTSEHKYM